MKFRQVHLNAEEYYSLGVDEETNEYVLKVIVTWVAWHSRFFRLTAAEFDHYPKNQAQIDALARACATEDGIPQHRERFLFSERSGENT